MIKRRDIVREAGRSVSPLYKGQTPDYNQIPFHNSTTSIGELTKFLDYRETGSRDTRHGRLAFQENEGSHLAVYSMGDIPRFAVSVSKNDASLKLSKKTWIKLQEEFLKDLFLLR
jgi:hypothetical protein